MKYLVCVLALSLLNGCPGPDIQVVEVPCEEDYCPHLAWELAEPDLAPPNPNPEPEPTPKGKCTNCNGIGKIDGDHDGKYDYDCEVCGGDGVLQQSILVLPSLMQEVPLQPKEEIVPIVMPDIEAPPERYMVWEGIEYVWDTDAFYAFTGKKIVMSFGDPSTETFVTMCKGDLCYRIDIQTRT
jgi:hypothetical protein